MESTPESIIVDKENKREYNDYLVAVSFGTHTMKGNAIIEFIRTDDTDKIEAYINNKYPNVVSIEIKPKITL